jgi:hypothetical protein
LKYIEEAEKKSITIRGKTKKVVGINNIPRLMKARRTPWYNLETNLERWDRAPILLPRRAYGNYACYWNKAKVVENENFIRIYPRNARHVLPLLAFLNSSLGEFFARVQANVYGGGVYDLRPDDVKKLRILDLNTLNDTALNDMRLAYDQFVKERDRSRIDKTVFEILEIKHDDIVEILTKLSELRHLSIISKGSTSPLER